MSQLSAAVRMYRRARRVRREGFRTYSGDARAICDQIIQDAFGTHQYFRVSSGHFCEFYIRDFGLCCEALTALGYREEVRATLRYALAAYARTGRITTSISPEGTPYDFPRFAPDSLAFLLYAITHTKNAALIKGHEQFLQREVDRFARTVIDPRTLLPRKDKKFSSIRDHAERQGACYDAVMAAVVARETASLGLRFPYALRKLRDALVGAYWNGTYFFQDLQRQPIVAGDANVFPFWTGIITDARMREDAITAVRAAGLDTPFPLRYVSSADAVRERTRFHIADMLVPGYERDTIWMHLGLAYLQVLREVDRNAADAHLRRIGKLIERHKTFLELYDSDGTPFRRSLYVTDEAMMWCANWRALTRRA